MNKANVRGVWVGLFLLTSVIATVAVTPPVVRSTRYDGQYSNVVHYAPQPWMNSNVTMTVEAWVFCNDLAGHQALVARHYSTNLYFGLNTNRLRFYRSGGTFADSDGTLVPGRWTHVAASYDGSFVRFYTNGVNAGTKALAHAGNNCTNGLSLGGERDLLSLGDIFAGGYAFNGYLDEVRLWSVTRSASAIASGVTNEFRSGAGLQATFGSGGNQNDIRAESGVTAGLAVVDRQSGFGIFPRNLCIPYTRNLLRVDGTIDLLNEYRGAETLVIRYTNANGHTDRPAYLMVSTNATNYHLFIGIPAVPASGGPQIPQMQIFCDVGVTGSTNSPLFDFGDWDVRLDQDGLQGGTIYGVNPPFFPTLGPLSWGQGVSNWQAVVVTEFEFEKNYEFRIHARHLNYFTNEVGLMLRHRNVQVTGDQAPAPFDASPANPLTWPVADWCGQADSGLVTITRNGVVTNVLTGTNESGWTVSLLTGPNEASATYIRSLPVAANGTFTISGQMPDDSPYWLRLEARTGYTHLAPEFSGAAGVNPDRTNTVRNALRYPPCGAGSCAARTVRFRVLPPPGPVSITSLSRSNGAPEVVLRDSPRKVAPASIVTLFGTNLHTQFEVYLSKCILDPPSFCTEGVDIFRVTVLSNDAARGSITVQLPADSGAFNGTLRWLLKDLWTSHPGWTQWVYGPAGFVVDRNLHPYPTLHGFEFVNEGDGPSLAEFESVYRFSIFNPFPPFRDPYYYVIWWPVYFGLGEGFRSGSCHGMAAASRLFERGLLSEATFDVPGSGGPNGVHYAAGFPSQPGEHPFRGADWTGFDLFQPYRPVDVWAVVREFMMAQYTEESFANTLSQLDYGYNLNGDPVGVLNRIRANSRNSILCFNPGGIGGGHCVTPYGVIDNFGLAAGSATAIVTNAGLSVIKVYDNNWPGQERFLQIDKINNRYSYPLSSTVTWSSKSLFTTPLTLFTGARHAPGASTFATTDFATFLRYIVGGQADVEHSDGSGHTWGWNNAGVFTNTYAGSKAVYPLFDFPTNRDVRSAVAFLPVTNAPTQTIINARGSNYVFHAGRDGTTYQLVVSNRLAGGADFAQLLVSNQAPAGLRFIPNQDLGTIRPMIGETSPDFSVVHVLIGLSLPSGHEIEMRSLRDTHGLAFFNRGLTPLNYALELQAVDAVSGLVCSNRYGPFTTPPGAAQRLTFPRWPNTTEVFSELDLGLDGTFEQTGFVAAERALFVNENGNEIVLKWSSSRPNEVLEATDELGPNAKWGVVTAPQEVNGDERTVKLQRNGPQRYFRLRP